jgi:tetratricopeptide (TPR) repeat protein
MAIMLYVQALKGNPGSRRFLEALASASLRQGDLAAAVGYYRQLIAMDPELPKAHGDLGVALCRSGDYYGAVTELKIALSTDSVNVTYVNSLGQAYVKLERRPQAEKCFNDVLRLDPENIGARVQLGILAYQSNDFPRAEKYLKGVLAITPSETEARYYVGLVALGKGELAEAEKHFHELETLTRNDARPFFGMGLVFAKRQGQADKAIKYFEKAVEVDPKLLDARWELAKLHESVGDKDQAYWAYKKILLTDPSFRFKEDIKRKLIQFREDGIVDDQWQNF